MACSQGRPEPSSDLPPASTCPDTCKGGQARRPADAAAVPLVSTRDKSGIGCPTPVLGMRFRLASGELVPVPCNRAKCPYCGPRSAMVTAKMIGIDAQICQPTVCSTFTTRDPVSQGRLREVSAQIMRLIRHELGPVRYCSFLEFTTGKAALSGGLRRPHLHTLWKDAPPDAAPVIAGAASHVLEQASGAWRHDVGEIRTPAGATMYVARHHQKEEQAPPRWWGPTRRVRPGRGYYELPAPQLRRMAGGSMKQIRLYMRLERELRELNPDVPDDVLEHYVDQRVTEELEQPPPEVVRICKPWEDRLAA